MTAHATGAEVTTDLTRISLDRVHRWLSQDAAWAIGWSRRTVELAARNSLNFGLVEPDGQLRAYGVVTDYATFAWLCDVYVDPAARGNGLGRQLTDRVAETLRPMRLKRVLLATDGAHELPPSRLHPTARARQLDDPDQQAEQAELVAVVEQTGQSLLERWPAGYGHAASVGCDDPVVTADMASDEGVRRKGFARRVGPDVLLRN